MTSDMRYFFGAALPRAQQFIFLALSFSLAVLWGWRAGGTWPASPPPLMTPQPCFIEIQGDIPRPGLHVFAISPTIQNVWEAACGQGAVATSGQPLGSGTKILVSPEGVLTLTTMSGGNLLTLGLALDLNLASREDLEALPGIGPVLARRIADFREKHGPFRDISELEQVTGVGPGKLAKLRPHVTVSRIGTDQEKQEE